MKRPLIAGAALVLAASLAACGSDAQSVTAPGETGASVTVDSTVNSSVAAPGAGALPASTPPPDVADLTPQPGAPANPPAVQPPPPGAPGQPQPPAPGQPQPPAPEPQAPSPSTSPAPIPGTPGPGRTDCLEADPAYKDVNLTGLPPAARETATALYRAAMACDTAALVRMAKKNRTELSFGGLSPEQYFALPQSTSESPYVQLIKLLGVKPTKEVSYGTRYVWPRVNTTAGGREDSAWRELITSGIYTEEEVKLLRSREEGYMGIRLGILPDGTWQYFIAGD